MPLNCIKDIITAYSKLEKLSCGIKYNTCFGKMEQKKGAIQLYGRIYVKRDIIVFTRPPKVVGKDLMPLRIELTF